MAWCLVKHRDNLTFPVLNYLVRIVHVTSQTLNLRLLSSTKERGSQSCRNASQGHIATLRNKTKRHLFRGTFFRNVLQFFMRITVEIPCLQTFCLSRLCTFVEEQEVLKVQENLVKVFHCELYGHHKSADRIF
jgi:hypothetical protein